jgi:copper(I)-binding protein
MVRRVRSGVDKPPIGVLAPSRFPLCATLIGSTMDGRVGGAAIRRIEPPRVQLLFRTAVLPAAGSGCSQEGPATVSRARRNPTAAPRLVPALLGLGVAAVLGVAGCSAGQITQTDTQMPAVNGGMGQVGSIALRNIELVYPQGGSYPQGGDAVLIGTIVNQGNGADELVSVTTPVARNVAIKGDARLPAGRTLVAEKGVQIAVPTGSVPHGTSSAAPSSGAAPTASVPPSVASPSSEPPTSEPPETTSAQPTASPTAPTSSAPATRGEVVITLEDLTEPLRSGRSIPITFVFRDGGSVTINVPIAVPGAPRAVSTQHQGDGH